ncbi:HesA/MoeB/ThiF family protein [Sulfuracidifex metallicus]|jgi:adenylyltransferase/sulfurtransferase|uniref:HesA/MoeB/ThiF family protein n=1 Tax=Sulfuracidifex metallicus DSM 6482 = JCM 9184 TaxID=523847 RepID=A0A6A9QMC4_SULME|nr:HesA/MoeB/ThiF family protein [Sulfuracidifex metallicus]MUN28341.1 HesA/MoeB/ThiF family protein [Sulfuracidifex metallicus DSM 6482 = JCM 9184]WOE51133.1 HesA/MoeB/ThiF family protein [Sulfuracidifex metallicus DSM 6482 = JCM 9184]
MERFSRQLLVLGLGGQEKISSLKVTIVGCGALGSKLSEELARLGVGSIKLVDADVVELSNLHRVSLFDEEDVGKPKAKICAEKLRKINHEIDVSYILDVVDGKNVEDIIKGSDFVFDALDTPFYRLILNDACVKSGIPLIYGGVTSWYGSAMFVSSQGPCLSCFMAESQEDACEVTGTLGIVVSAVVSIQVGLMLKALNGNPDQSLFYIDMKDLTVKSFKIGKNPECKTCVKREFPHLNENLKPTCGLIRINSGEIQGKGFTVIRGKDVIICHENGKCFKKVKS